MERCSEDKPFHEVPVEPSRKLVQAGFQSFHSKGGLDRSHSITRFFQSAGVDFTNSFRVTATLPFSFGDVTAGSESELQAVVKGRKGDVDLPIVIEQSNYYRNILRRIQAGETPRTVMTDLEKYLQDQSQVIWENSWVRFPLRFLNPLAASTLETDLLADKSDPHGGTRSDVDRFLFHQGGERWLRIPVSYLIKLSLAHLLGSRETVDGTIREAGMSLLHHFLNDNTSPETTSFHVVPLNVRNGSGRAVARETSKRYLLTQLLTMYANEAFGLRSMGQEAIIYFAPHPPIRQKEFNECVSDAFYRELFMSPCLSGWDRGEEKHRYMVLCHKVLSRSQLNAVVKLREAGIIANNLVVLPNLSNVSLANNGIHVSVGSLKLTEAFKDPSHPHARADEKFVGDLAIKIVEHFLPLFVGTYSAAPYRMDFCDFHPERALGYLPHELDYTHLRMIWRRWKKKARLKVFGRPITPFGPRWLDEVIKTLFSLKGDFIQDFRLIDYFVCLMSTESSPALNGAMGNGERLKRDLFELGAFDTRMAVYLLYRLRECHVSGFSGFEGRYYSLFESLEGDMGKAVDLQVLVTALAMKYIATGKVAHRHIPDSPSIESERRQIFFGTAIGIPTFYVHKNTGNAFLFRILERCRKVRQSRRYPNHYRVYNLEYRRALLEILQEDGRDLLDLLGMGETVNDLRLRMESPDEFSAAGRLTGGILNTLGASSPLRAGAREFNMAAEEYYRRHLRAKHLAEALAFLEEDLRAMDSGRGGDGNRFRESLRSILPERQSALRFLGGAKEAILAEGASRRELLTTIHLLLLSIENDKIQAAKTLEENRKHGEPEAPVRRAAHG